MDPLFPTLPKELTKLTDKELADLLAEHEQAAGLIDADDTEFLGSLGADEIIEQYRTGAEQIKTLRAEAKAREDAAANFDAAKAEIAAEIKGETPEPDPKPVPPDDGDENDAKAEVETTSVSTPEAENEVAPEVEETVETREPVLVADASNVTTTNSVVTEPPRLRRVPVPAADRVVVNEPEKSELSFVASGLLPSTPPGKKFESAQEITDAVIKLARSIGAPSHREGGREEKLPVAQLDYSSRFPDDRTLDGDWQGNSDKLRKIGSPYFGQSGLEALLASGGLCAPLTPIYTMPQLATNARPVRDALPNFRAARGGVNVPTPTTIGDASGAITVITEADDAAGGTFATKSCLALDCPTYTETAVTIISHCREFGNLNAMAWPEKIAHENEITMAEHARVADSYLLDRIKTLSVNVTSGVETLGALIYLVDAITKSAYGIRSRLRLPREARFQALLPAVALDILLLDTVQTQFDRYRGRGQIEDYLNSVGIDVTWYLDTPSTGTSQIADSTQTAAALDAFPDNIQWALFPAGTFLHIDMAELNLGIVRDSTLNSTNDFQFFGEVFENVARIGPAQAAYWETTDICSSGQFPPAGTARTCD